MIAVDTQVLVYAHRGEAPLHDAAAARLRDLAGGARAWAIPWPCLHEFLGVVTHPRVYRPPTPLDRAVKQVDAWLESPTLVVLGEAGDHWPRLRGLLSAGAVTGPRVHDARVAALCLSHGIDVLWSTDRDFGRFPALRVVNPLVE